MPEDHESEQERIESELFRELEEAKEGLIQAVAAMNQAADSASASEPLREACRAAYERYQEALDRFTAWVLGPRSRGW